jgi:hypothetical protein
MGPSAGKIIGMAFIAPFIVPTAVEFIATFIGSCTTHLTFAVASLFHMVFSWRSKESKPTTIPEKKQEVQGKEKNKETSTQKTENKKQEPEVNSTQPENKDQDAQDKQDE